VSDLDPPILRQSFAIIDRELGDRRFAPDEYAVVRRAIHATADFEFAELIQFSSGAIATGTAVLRRSVPIVVDTHMVQQLLASRVRHTFGNLLLVAADCAPAAAAEGNRTEAGLQACFANYPGAVYAIGSDPLALMVLCGLSATAAVPPALVVGAPVGFVHVVEAKQALAQTRLAQIRVEGRKGGSPVAAAIVDALLAIAWLTAPPGNS